MENNSMLTEAPHCKKMHWMRHWQEWKHHHPELQMLVRLVFVNSLFVFCNQNEDAVADAGAANVAADAANVPTDAANVAADATSVAADVAENGSTNEHAVAASQIDWRDFKVQKSKSWLLLKLRFLCLVVKLGIFWNKKSKINQLKTPHHQISNKKLHVFIQFFFLMSRVFISWFLMFHYLFVLNLK